MSKRNYKIIGDEKYNASLATEIVDLMSKFSSKVLINYNDDIYDTKSIINLMTLELEPSNTITFEAIGVDADKALDSLEKIMKENEVI